MKLSIITINYNNCDGLRKTIDSVVNQTWQEFEWIIVDGGSTDGSRELIEETAAKLANEGTPASPTPWHVEQFSLLGFTAEDWKNGKYPSPASREAHPRTLLWTSEKDNGIYNAMNKGIVMAHGEYCLFLNSGDWLVDDKVFHDIFKKGYSEDLICGIMLEDTKEKKELHSYFTNKKFGAYDLFRDTLPHQATFIKKAMIETCNYYNEAYKIVSDWVLFCEAYIQNDANIVFVKRDITYSQVGGVSSIDKDAIEKERKTYLNHKFSKRIIQDYTHVEMYRIITANKITSLVYSLLCRLTYYYKHLLKK